MIFECSKYKLQLAFPSRTRGAQRKNTDHFGCSANPYTIAAKAGASSAVCSMANGICDEYVAATPPANNPTAINGPAALAEFLLLRKISPVAIPKINSGNRINGKNLITLSQKELICCGPITARWSGLLHAYQPVIPIPHAQHDPATMNSAPRCSFASAGSTNGNRK